MTQKLYSQTIPSVQGVENYCFDAKTPLTLDQLVSINGTATDLLDGIQIAISQNYSPTEDQLTYTEADGITGAYDSANGILTLSGSADLDAYNLALSRVIFTTSATDNAAGAKDITVSLSNLDYYPETGHFYKFFAERGILWTKALVDAENKDLFGLKGYLATITTSGENDFILARVSGTSWIGASDRTTEGDWRWVTGPEGLFDGGVGRRLSDGFTNWETDEPNNAGGEEYAHMMDWSSPPGKWNDLADGGSGGQFTPTGYIVEYGGQPGDPDVFSSITSTTTLDILQEVLINGAISVCPNLMGVTYTASSLVGYSYNWTVEGGTIASGQGTSEILVNWGVTNANASVSVVVSSPILCQVTTSYPVKINVQLEPPLPLGNTTVCYIDLTQPQTYNTPSTPGSDYNWFVTNGQIVSGNGTNEIQVLWDGPGSGDLYFTESTSTATDICDGDSPLLTVDLREEIVPTFDIENVKCFGGIDGSIRVSGINGLAPYTYTWNVNGQGNINDSLVTGLSAGNYSVDITSAGCTINVPFTITEPEPLSGTINVTDVLCFGESSGIAEALITGGTGDYRYVWSQQPNVNQNRLTNIPKGSYSVDIYDENDCLLTLNFNVDEPDRLIIENINATLISCPGGNDGTLEASVSGGVAPYSYSWEGSSDTSPLATGFSKGTYRLIVTDANGCTTAASQSVEEATPKILFPNAFSPNGDGMNDTFGPTTPCTIIFNMQVYSRWGEVIFSTQNAQTGWDGTLNGQAAASEKYSYIANWTIEVNGLSVSSERRGVVKLIR
ncbi:gliding motility-associated C-terminal domain-containing protein [Roseivirga sp.]|uniref:T9SS type B sorting domain-containing protein n=1 Tax=Roseivirga sp. TaxID=1964215 RepID=UPI003B8CE8D2